MLSISHSFAAAPRQRREAPAPASDAFRRDMLTWADPVIADCIADAYETSGLGVAYRGLLTSQHRRLWRALILDRKPQAEMARGDLLRNAARAGLDPDTVQDVDHEVLEEMMDVVVKRFRASRESARGYGLVLLAAASSLGTTRAAAA